MKKAQVKLGFRSLSIPSKIQKAAQIVQLMTKNDFFPDPNPKLTLITEATNSLETAYQNAMDGGRKFIVIRNDQEDVLNDLMFHLSSYVQNESDGSEEKIRSAGFDVRAQAGPIGDLERPLNLRSTTSAHSGEVQLDWKPVHGAKSYVAEKSVDGSNDWQLCGHSTRSRMMVTDLPSTTTQWFRIAGIGAAGQGPWSDPVKGLVA
jgi:hypothetical protein